MELAPHYLDEVRRQFRGYKRLGEGAIAQLKDEELFVALDPEANSIAVIVKHLAGNMRSRFTDFLTTDGEKPDRNRDGEFEMAATAPREELLRGWEVGWSAALESLDALRPDDLDRTVRIRTEPFAVVEALNRSITHTAYHIGQIVYLARHFAGADWRSLSIPKGMSSQHLQGEFRSKGLAR